MEFFSKQTKFDFIGQQRKAIIISAILIILSFVLLFTRGLNFGLDFTGGTLVELGYAEAADLDEARSLLENSEFAGAVIQNYGSASEVLIRLAPVAELDNAEVGNKVLAVLQQGGQQIEMRRIEFVGAQVGDELAESGGLATLFALLGILAYVSVRFQARFAIGAIVALVHDVMITFGFFSLTQMNFDLGALAAVLTVIGYSLNDTIVVYDRIRDNFRRLRNATVIEVFNISLNQTLSRTIMTGVTTLLVLGALFFLGGESLHAFSTILILGIVIGTFSSIYIASPVTIALGISRKDLMPVEREGADLPDRP
jgi:preprotein translocase subunit SecF